ncbi:MAG: SelB C-terminal domain-containing protein [Chloroflexota bacterium]
MSSPGRAGSSLLPCFWSSSACSPYPAPLRHNTTVSFFTGAAETVAQVRLLREKELKPGAPGWAQLILDRPVAAVKGDHFILRSTTETLGGGRVIDPHPPRLRRLKPAMLESLRVQEEGTAEEMVTSLIEAHQPVVLSAFLARPDLPPGDIKALLDALIQQGEVVSLGKGESGLLFTRAGWENLKQKAVATLKDYHQKFPTRTGMPRVELGTRLEGGTSAQAVIQRLQDEGVLQTEGLVARLPTHRIQLTPAQQAAVDAFLRALGQNPYAPPPELTLEPALLNLLVEQHKVVRVGDNVVFLAVAYQEMVKKVTEHLKAKGKVTLAEVRDLFQTSRKYAQALLEHLDREKVTKRVGDERVLW